MRYALIQGGMVATVVEQNSMPTIGGQWVDITGAHVGPGFVYEGNGVFSEPDDKADWRIKVGAFFNRFGDDTIPLLASSDAVIQAWVKLAMAQDYIDLKSAKTAQGIDVLKSKPGFNIDKDAILNTVPTEDERYKGK